jgi:hypothetical protein
VKKSKCELLENLKVPEMPFPAIWAKFYKITKIYSSIMF